VRRQQLIEQRAQDPVGVVLFVVELSADYRVF
jgi:hypothetical protein